MPWTRRCFSLFSLALSACEPCDHPLTPVGTLSASTQAAFADYDPGACTPDAQAWETNVRPVVEAKCGACHGTEPSFGAPLPLLDYAGILAGEPGQRPVDRFALRAAQRTMPPPTSAALAHDELDLLVEWATCGEVHPDHSVGLEVDAELYAPEVPSNTELPSFDVTADAFEVGRDTLDLYQCFAIEAPVDEDRFIRRLQVVLDDARVLHHVVVAHDPEGVSAGRDRFECSDWPAEGTSYLWAWAPGTQAFDFEEGGLRISPGDRIVVQIHYNNGAGIEQVRDSSGVRVFHGPSVGQEWFMYDPGPQDFAVPEGESSACDRERIPARTRVLAGMPHMHELGAEFHQWIERSDGSEEPLINLTGWNFEAQRFYRHDVVLERGDRLHTWCGFRNNTGEPAYFGLGTADEMCFNFMYIDQNPS